MASMSGMNFDSDGKCTLEELNDPKNERNIGMWDIGKNSVQTTCFKEKKIANIEEIVKAVEDHKAQPCWASFVALINAADGRQVQKKFLLSYCPDTLTVKSKMTHASTHGTVKKALNPNEELKIDDENDLTLESVCSKIIEKAKGVPGSSIEIISSGSAKGSQ